MRKRALTRDNESGVALLSAILVLMLMDLCLLFILPAGVIRYFADSSAAVLSQTVLFVLLMFMPLCMSFLYRWLRHCSAVRFFSKTNA